MRTISEEILERFQLRKTRRQKTAFIEWLTESLQKEGIECRVESGGMARSRNIIVGDVASAKTVFAAHYDTAPLMPFPNFITPCNPVATVLYMLLIAAGTVLLMGGFRWAVGLLIADPAIVSILSLAFIWFIVGMLLFGKANPHTANDNTSGVITLCEIMLALSPEQREKVAFVFFDNEEIGLVGSAFFARKHKKEMREKPLINFDCVSDGDHLLMLRSRKMRKSAFDALLTEAFSSRDNVTVHFVSTASAYFPSDQSNFPCHVAAAFFHRQPLIGLYMGRIHTGRDVIFTRENIRFLCDGAVKYTELL